MFPFQTFSARLVCSSTLSEFTKHLEFEVVGKSRFGFGAGLDKMVKANRELLKSQGWDRKSIRYEKYE